MFERKLKHMTDAQLRQTADALRTRHDIASRQGGHAWRVEDAELVKEILEELDRRQTAGASL